MRIDDRCEIQRKIQFSGFVMSARFLGVLVVLTLLIAASKEQSNSKLTKEIKKEVLDALNYMRGSVQPTAANMQYLVS